MLTSSLVVYGAAEIETETETEKDRTGRTWGGRLPAPRALSDCWSLPWVGVVSYPSALSSYIMLCLLSLCLSTLLTVPEAPAPSKLWPSPSLPLQMFIVWSDLGCLGCPPFVVSPRPTGFGLGGQRSETTLAQPRGGSSPTVRS